MPVPENELPQPPQPLTGKQAKALEMLRAAGKPMEYRQLARVARCGQGPVEALALKGFVRREVRRIDRFIEEQPDDPVEINPALTLNADQLRVWPAIEQAVQQ